MIQLEITGVHFEITDQVKSYAQKRIGRLDKYLPRNARSGAQGHIVLIEEQGKAKNRYSAEATVSFPHGEVTAKESTISMYAAIDIVEEKLKTQILKHKERSQDRRKSQRKLRRLKSFRFDQSE